MNTRVNFVLLTAVLASAFYLVNLKYESRTAFAALDQAQSAARKLETERDTLDVQKRAQTAALRVQTLARSELKMGDASPAITQYVAIKEGGVEISSPVEAKQPAAPAKGAP